MKNIAFLGIEPRTPGAVFTNVRKSQILDSAQDSDSDSDSALQNLIHET